jgi:SAM-dependent methyltransferase
MNMSKDIRSDAVRYYDYNPHFPDDISFYAGRIPSPDVDVLELGCGTGRVIIPLSQYCRSMHGIDLSKSMIATKDLEWTRRN